MVDESDTVLSWDKSPTPMGAGHHLISVDLAVQGLSPQPKIITTRRLGKLDEPDALEAFSAIDWPAILAHDQSGDAALERFYGTFFRVLDSIAPITAVRVNSTKHAPWLTPELVLEQRRTRTTYRRYRRTKRRRDLMDYRLARSTLRGKLSAARTAYYRSRLDKLSPNEMWQELRNLGLIKAASSPPLVVPPDQLNRAFAQVSTISSPTVEAKAADNLAVDGLSQHQGPKFNLTPITLSEVTETVATLKSNPAGADGLNAMMIKSLLGTLTIFLVALFNRSITASWFPTA